MPDETIKLTIDGQEIEVPKGTTVLQAAEKLGLQVPRYCYHPGLSIAGNCRICLVDIEKMPKLVTSCTTQAGDGMVVRTAGEKVEDGRRFVMEFLLANHPLDCPICDQAGECWLQDYSYRHGQGDQRFREPRIKGFKQKPVGEHVVLDTERCIVCTRCVRFCDEVTGTGELGVFTRGAYSYIDTFPGRMMDNPYSGNTVDICPVGALTLSDFRFRKRVWYLKNVPSICGSCARGCNVDLGTADNAIWRITPRLNPEVNKWWMCDEGRLSYRELDERPRLEESRHRETGPDGWIEAIDGLAGRVKGARPGRVAALVSSSATIEDLWMIRRLFDECIEGGRIIVPENRRGEDDAILIRADKTPNAKGAELLGLPVDEGNRTTAELLDAARQGELDVLLVFGKTPVPLTPAAGGKAFICAVTPFADGTARDADLALPGTAYGEFDGTWVNFQGRAQRVRRARVPRHVALEPWRVCAELMTRLGVEARHGSAEEVLAEASAANQALAPLGTGPIGERGVAL